MAVSSQKVQTLLMWKMRKGKISSGISRDEDQQTIEAPPHIMGFLTQTQDTGGFMVPDWRKRSFLL